MFSPRDYIDMALVLGSDIDLGNATREQLQALALEAFRYEIDALLP